MKKRNLILAGFVLLFVSAMSLPAQSLFATLTGVVSDPSQAVVPNATVKLINEQSGSTRETATNAEGYFTFASVSVGNFTYSLTVEASGFVTYKATALALGGGEKRNVNVTLSVGTTSETVEVTGVAESIVPVDSGEKSQTLTTKELENYVVIGTNAAQFIKIMPGFGIRNGTQNKSGYTGEVIGINANGDGGSQSPLNGNFSYNGLPGNSLDIVADGAHVSDPGCNCDTPVNPNAEMVSEFKVLTSNFSAENQKGPAVISTVTKSGGQQFHGSAFFSARHFAMNANDWLNNKTGTARPESKFFFPGGTIGGPVVVPGTGFNKNRDKLFFFTGFQYFKQTLDTSNQGLLRATVPTPGMLQGNFSQTELAKLGNVTALGRPSPPLNAESLAKWPNGIIPASQLDPNMVNLAKLYPAANADPNTTGGYNFVQAPIFEQPNRQWTTRVDYNISDNTKLFVRYNYQRETQSFPVGLWWRQTNQVPYPTSVLGKNRSDSVSASLTHVFSPSMTNEFVFGYSFIGFPNVFEDPSKVDRTKVGYNYKGLYKNGVAQIPSFAGGNSETALIFNPGGFEAGGPSSGLYANKYMPSFSDIVSKVYNTHTIKAGFFYEWIRNAQPANGNTNGNISVSYTNPYSSGSNYADFLLGVLSNYNEQSFNRINNISYNTYEGFVQDSWKATRRLTLEFGIRFTHFQPWVDREGFGFSIFDYSKYNANCKPSDYCGFLWNARDPSVPLGGFPTRSLFYQPRFGFAYDLRGSGQTVLRGGWGRFYYHAGQFTSGLDVSAGVQTITLANNIGGVPLRASQIDSLQFTSEALSPAAVDSKADQQPYVDSYSFTIAQRTPWSGLLEIAYVGNRSRDIPSQGNGGSLGFNTNNINLVPVGSMLASRNGGADPNTLVANNFRPLRGFSDLNLATYNGYSDYNSLQLTWQRSRGRYNINLNYTFSKAMGLINFDDQFNLQNNYGVLPTNRTHLFNIAYSVELGNPVKSRVPGALLNGWQLSGITQVQSGAELWSNSTNRNFNMNLNSAKVPGTNHNISNVSILGTPNLALRPLVTCDPTQNLGKNQYVNGSCFAMPTRIGENGPTVLPPIYGPMFFNWDLGLFKNFTVTESKTLQFRFDGYNFLNHPLTSFAGGNNLSLIFSPTTGKLDNPIFGYATEKQGRRIIQMSVKFIF